MGVMWLVMNYWTQYSEDHGGEELKDAFKNVVDITDNGVQRG